jgi:predicted oxidoreductase (fatty acid repression mutant protein)
VKEVLKPLTPEDAYPNTVKKLESFQAGYGTVSVRSCMPPYPDPPSRSFLRSHAHTLTRPQVLFFEDPHPTQELADKFALYAQHFPVWAEHSNAMHQYVLWTALEAEGFGASLQHYNPVVDQRAQNEWGVPLEWHLRAQLVFGGRAGEPGDKAFEPLEKRVFVHGK